MDAIWNKNVSGALIEQIAGVPLNCKIPMSKIDAMNINWMYNVTESRSRTRTDYLVPMKLSMQGHAWYQFFKNHEFYINTVEFIYYDWILSFSIYIKVQPALVDEHWIKFHKDKMRHHITIRYDVKKIWMWLLVWVCSRFSSFRLTDNYTRTRNIRSTVYYNVLLDAMGLFAFYLYLFFLTWSPHFEARTDEQRFWLHYWKGKNLKHVLGTRGKITRKVLHRRLSGARTDMGNL